MIDPSKKVALAQGILCRASGDDMFSIQVFVSTDEDLVLSTSYWKLADVLLLCDV